MMKQDALVSMRPGEETHAFCPVECPVCRYENNVYPARFHTRDLVEGADLSGMERKANHILFLLEGMLHIRTQTDNHYHLDSGQCMFRGRAYPTSGPSHPRGSYGSISRTGSCSEARTPWRRQRQKAVNHLKKHLSCQSFR